MGKELLRHLLALVVFNIISSLHAQEIIGCGGFIKSNTDINYNIIQVKLFTKDKILKYTTESSSVNGYYMIPVYNKGEYILKVEPPPGWSFDPTEIPLNIDGVNDACSKNEDLNFYFKGFGLNGKVATYGDVNRKGPSNVKLDLLNSKNEIVSSTLSANDGSYYFSNIMPGNYQVKASHPTWKFKTDRVSVTLSKDNWSAKDNIIVSGYSIEGYVLSGDKKPLKNAMVALKFNSANLANIDTSKFECERNAKVLDSDELCYVLTNEQGKYAFHNIGFQKYTLRAAYRLDNSILIYSKPDSINVDLLKHDNALVGEKFELNFLNLVSRAVIVDSANNQEVAFENARLFVNDKEVVSEKTGKTGEFKLDNLVHGVQYKFSLQAEHVYFEEKSLVVDLSLKSIQNSLSELKSLLKFSAKSLDICGKIKFKQEIRSTDLARLAKIIRLKVYQNLANKPSEEINVRFVNIDENLGYCFRLNKSPIQYIVKIDTTNAASSSSSNDDLDSYLKFISDEKRITVNRVPILDLNFEQFDAELSGTVEFLSEEGNEFKCPADFKLHLKSQNRGEFVKEITNLKCNPAKRQLEFQMKNVLFGQYYLVSSYDDLYCWNLGGTSSAEHLVLNVAKEKEVMNLKQAGYKLAYTFHNLNVEFKITNAEKSAVLSQKKLTSQSDLTGAVCIKQLNQNLIIEFDSCHLLKPAVNTEQVQELSLNKYSIKLKNLFSEKHVSNKIEFVSSKHTLKIDINSLLDKNQVESSLTSDFKEIEVHVYEITGSTSASEEEIIQDKEPVEKILIKSPKFTRTADASQLTFASTSWLSAERTYLFKPISKKYLFRPTFTKYKLDSVNCNSNFIKFNAKLGLFIKGNVVPSDIDGYEVTLKTADNTAVISSEMTDGKTGFHLGPFEGEHNEDLLAKYRIEVVKSGYVFKLASKQVGNGEYVLGYSAEKLGELRIHVHEAADNLESVLVSLSSSNKQFRKIIKTNANGIALFDNLEADIYYMLVMMQEYEFKPNSQVVNVTSGFVFTIGVEAKRVAYSCHGKVNTINGLSVGDVIVQAHGVDDGNEALNCKQSQENTKSDNETGVYRIRGLKPNCKYEINVQQNDNTGLVYKIIPQSYSIQVSQRDALDVNFILIDNVTHTSEIALRLNLVSSKSVDYKADTVQKSFRNNVRIKLYKLAQPDSILQTFVVPSNAIFYLPRLARDHQHYLLSVELLTPTATVTAMSAQQQSQQQVAVIDREELVFQTDKLFKQLHVNFDLDVRKHPSFSSFAGSYFDSNGQQYQTIYFTLPLFLIILTIVYFKFKDLVELAKLIKQKLENTGYLNNLATTTRSTSQQQPKTSQKTLKTQQQSKPQTSDKSSSNEHELDSSSNNSSIDVIDNEGNSISPKKARVRKA